jgi:hypothetical protein
MPAATVLIVFHRLNPFFGEAVRSVLTQTFRDFELLLVDNGAALSADALGEMARDPRLRWLRLPRNLGIPGGHNAGVAAAAGEFVMLLDYDDIALPVRLEKQIAALRAEPRLGLVSSCAESIDERGAVIGREFALLGVAEQRRYLEYTTPVVTPAFSGRREAFARFPYRDVFPVAADYDFLARASEVWDTRGLPEVLFRYRRHAQQTTALQTDSQVLSACFIRLLAARRRAGRAEQLDATAAELGPWLAAPPRAADTYARFARWALREGFPRLAVFHARRVVRGRRDARTLAWATGVLARAVACAPREAGLLADLFLRGPVKAHGLRPA